MTAPNILIVPLPGGAYSLEVRIQKIAQKDGKEIPSDAVWSDYSSSSPYEKPTEKSIGISLDDAKKLAQEKQMPWALTI